MLLKEFAHENRKNMTEAERILWNELKDNALGHSILRQHIIGDYIVDFLCKDDGLIIEVDGGCHSEPRQIVDDAVRQHWLEGRGYHFPRFTNEEIINELDSVLEEIEDYFER